MLTPTPRTALRRNPSPTAMGWKLPSGWKGFNYLLFSSVGSESLAEIVFVSNLKGGQSAPCSVNGRLFGDELIAGRLSDRHAMAGTKDVARFTAEQTGGKPTRAHYCEYEKEPRRAECPETRFG